MIRASRWTVAGLTAALLGSVSQGQQSTERMSVDSVGVDGNADSHHQSVSADGRFVAFGSNASNLVLGDTNGVWDVFVHDRLGATELVSKNSLGVQGNSFSRAPSISPDGRFVAFESDASNLAPGITNGYWNVFVRDRQLLTTTRVSLDSNGLEGDGNCSFPSISADSRFVAFVSGATNLDANDSNGCNDIFVRDLLLGTTQRISLNSAGLQGNNASNYPSISADGRFVAFSSFASNLAANDTNGTQDVFVRDRLNGTTACVSVDSSGSLVPLSGYTSSISDDGRFVAFTSLGGNLAPNDNNGSNDVFARDLLLGMTERMSVNSAGTEGNSDSSNPSISGDNRFVAFESYATNLVASDTNSRYDVFVHERQGGTTERISVNSLGAQANWDSSTASISTTGRFVAFSSTATNLVAGDNNNSYDVFLRDRGAPPPSPFCLGDGSAAACPCANSGGPGRGCENSAATGGALLSSTGTPSLASDTLVLTSSGELPNVLSIFLQGNSAVSAAGFGDGLRCTGGILKRLYIRNASGGVVSVPQPGDPSISARSAALGDLITAGATRYYQTYYRDPTSFCTSLTYNITNGVQATWAP